MDDESDGEEADKIGIEKGTQLGMNIKYIAKK